AERRLVGMLARKGYGGGLAGYVVREALDALTAELLAEDERLDDLPAETSDESGPVGPEVGEGQVRGLGRRAARPGDAWEDHLP
ncbi:hypothetical protein A7K94_0206305, partial [Modestobacter sp. VKM Ac-2676]